MVGFLVGFSLMCFSTSDNIVVVLVSITWFMLCFLLLWCISMLHEGRPFQVVESYRCLSRRLKDLIKELEWFIQVLKPQGTSVHSGNGSNGTELTSSRQLS